MSKEERRLIGYFSEGTQRFCYVDEKIHGSRRDHNIPVYAIKEPKCCEDVRMENERLKKQIQALKGSNNQ